MIQRTLLMVFGLSLLLLSFPLIGKGKAAIAQRNEKTFRVLLDPLHRTEISAEIRSPVVLLTKKMGDRFEKGELLVQLDPVIYKSNLEKARAELERATVELDGKKQLYNEKVTSLFDLKRAEADFIAAQADVAEAEKFYAATEIKAPYDGKLVHAQVEMWELPEIGDLLIEIVDDHILIAKVLLPSSLLNKIKPGSPFTITLDETGEKIPAQVTRIGAIIDPASATIPIEAEIDNNHQKYTSGMKGRATFNLSSQQGNNG